MKISDVMRRQPHTISETDSLGVAQFAMTRAHIRHLPVISGGRLVGMLSERDVLAARAHASDEGDWCSITVHDAMQQPVQTAAPDDPLNEVAGRMAASKIGAMPVVERGKLLGIATVADVLEAEVRDAMGPSPQSHAIAADIMTPWPVTVAPETLLSKAVELMVRRHIRHLPVVAAGQIAGMLSERDVRAAIGDPVQYVASHCDIATAQLYVRDVMTGSAIVVAFDTPIAELARRFADDRIGALPVTDKFGALIGIVSYVDALRVLLA